MIEKLERLLKRGVKKIMKKIKLRVSEGVTLFTILHFLVDGICALVIFSALYNNDYNQCLTIFLVYNFLAFLTQPLVGLLIDKYNYPKLFLIIAVGCLILGIVFKAWYLPSSILLGIGNSFFHVSGGKYVTEKTNNGIASLGLFVSTGAIGLVVGQRYYTNTLLIVFSLLTILIMFILTLSEERKEDVKPFTIVRYSMGIKYFVVLFALIITVMIRSFVGKICIIDFQTSNFVFLLMGIMTAGGKALGGVMSKYLGVTKTIVISMVISFITLVFFNDNLYLTLFGIVAFNTTMPITLWYMNKMLNKKLGFAFGILAAGLIPGYLLGMLFSDVLIRQILIGSLSVLSIGLIFGVKKMEMTLSENIE